MNVKEHVLISVLAGSASGRPHVIDNVVVQASEQFLNEKSVNLWNSVIWVVCSQMIGFGFVGIFRGILVKPASMIWPHSLPDVALYSSFHSQPTSLGDDATRFHMSRTTFFGSSFQSCLFINGFLVIMPLLWRLCLFYV